MLQRLGIWAIFIIVIGLIIWGMVVANNKDGKVTYGELSVPVSSADWQIGNASSTNVLVEYGDIQCPACGTFHPVLKKLVTEKGKDFLFVFRHFPLTTVHQNAEASAVALEAAGRQGKFWEMHDMLYETQDVWSSLSNPRDVFIADAVKLGLDATKFATDLDDKSISAKITADYKTGLNSGVQGTPTFYFNGKQINNPRTYEDFVALIAPKIQ